MNRFGLAPLRLFRVPAVSTCSRFYAVGGKVVPVKEDKGFVETDAKKICEYVCINYHMDGEEPGPKILPDSEYPSWLFELNLAEPLPLEDMTPEEHGWLYWRAVQKRQREQMDRIKELKVKKIHLQPNPRVHRPKIYHK